MPKPYIASWSLAAHWRGRPGIRVNYTFTGDGIGATDGQGNTIPNLSEHQANATLFYQIRNLEARLAYSFRSEYTRFTAAGITNLAEVQNNASQLDFAASYNINDDLALTLDVTNLTDRVHEIYLDETRLRAPFRVFSEGRAVAVGLRYAL